MDTGTDYIVKHLAARVLFALRIHLHWLRFHFHWILHSLGIILVGPKDAEMMPRDCKTQQKWTQRHPKGCQNDAEGVQNAITMNPGTPKRGPMRKRAVFGLFPPPIWTPILTHFRLKMRKTDKVTTFLEDLEPTHIFSRNFFKTGEPWTSKMCLKHSKYAVGCKVGFRRKNSSKWPPRAPFGRPFGITLEHFGHPMAPQRHF